MRLALLVVLTQAAVARGDLDRLARFADRVEPALAQEHGNLLAPAVLRALQRWPGLVSLELRLPVTPVEARQLRALRRFAALVPPGRERDRSLKLLAPALVRTSAAAPAPLAPTGCPGAQAAGEVLVLEQGAGDCVLEWLSQRLELRPDPPRPEPKR